MTCDWIQSPLPTLIKSSGAKNCRVSIPVCKPYTNPLGTNCRPVWVGGSLNSSTNAYCQSHAMVHSPGQENANEPPPIRHLSLLAVVLLGLSLTDKKHSSPTSWILCSSIVFLSLEFPRSFLQILWERQHISPKALRIILILSSGRSPYGPSWSPHIIH